MDEHAKDEPTDRVLSADSRFFGALLDGDREALDAVLAPDFVMVEVNAGAVVSRADFMELTSSGEVRFNAIESFNDEAIVRFYGPTAVLVSRTAMRLTLPDGSSFSSGSRYTHVFVSSEGADWRLASAQGTQIAGHRRSRSLERQRPDTCPSLPKASMEDHSTLPGSRRSDHYCCDDRLNPPTLCVQDPETRNWRISGLLARARRLLPARSRGHLPPTVLP